MSKIKTGYKVKVCAGSGIDSDRTGIVLNSRSYSQDWIKKNEPGRYNRFDSKKESLIRDSDGNIFTMFNNRLIVI